MIGWRFREFDPEEGAESTFDKLLKQFQELLLHTSGDIREALSWLTELDREYGLTDENYGLADFIQDLIDKGMPVVMFDRVCEYLPSDKVIVDDYEGSYNAAEHLIQQGYKRIAHLTISH